MYDEERKNKRCFRCKSAWQKGHKCDDNERQKHQSNNIEVTNEVISHSEEFNPDESMGSHFINQIFNNYECNVTDKEEDSKSLLHTTVTINGIEGTALVDCGATSMFVSKEFVEKHEIKISSVSGEIRGGSGQKLSDRIGVVEIEDQNGRNTVRCEADGMIMPKGSDLVIGLSHFTQFWFQVTGVPFKLPENKISKMGNDETPKVKCIEAFAPADLSNLVAEAVTLNESIPPNAKCTHEFAVLRIEPTMKAQYWNARRFVQKKDESRVRKEIIKWYDNGTIERALENCMLCNPILAVPKKDNNGLKIYVRPCLDLRSLNKIIKDVQYPLPKIRDILDHVGSVAGEDAIFTSLDIIWGYFHFKVRESSRNYLAFMWDGLHYRFTCAPFGVGIMAALFQMGMDKILAGLPYAIAYIDDITIFSQNKKDHVQHVVTVINLLSKFKLPIKVGKSRFGQRKVRLLEFVISGHGIEMDHRKVEALLNWPRPRTVKQLTRFLGATNYYNQFVKKLFLISSSLDKIRKKTGEIKWNTEMKAAFEGIKKVLPIRRFLHYPDDSKPYEIWTDASKTGVGAWIAQNHDELRTLAFASRALSSSEKNYPATKRELLGIVWSLVKFISYIHGAKFTVFTDHNALIYLFTQNTHE